MGPLALDLMAHATVNQIKDDCAELAKLWTELNEPERDRLMALLFSPDNRNRMSGTKFVLQPRHGCLGGWGKMPSVEVPSVEQCRAKAREFRTLAADPKNSPRRSSVLISISRSWAGLASQLENLALVEKLDGRGR
jgi:hypothetical protein